MWTCHKCRKPVYFAERKQSLGYDWHPECLRCEECGKRLNPGLHAEHKGVPYCHIPCYGALFGPQLFGHGTRVESHTSFGKVEHRSSAPTQPRSHLESKLKVYNQYFDGKSGEIKSREVNGRLVLEGALRIHWGVLGMIHLKEDDDQRTVVTVRKRSSYKNDIFSGVDFEVSSLSSEKDLPILDSEPESLLEPSSEECFHTKASESNSLPSKLDSKKLNWDELDDLLQVERKPVAADALYQTMPKKLSGCYSYSVTSEESCNNTVDSRSESQENSALADNGSSKDSSNIGSGDCNITSVGNNSNIAVDSIKISRQNLERQMHKMSLEETDESNAYNNSCYEKEEKATKTSMAAIKRRSGRRRSRVKLRRRCSINGHFYNRETSFFTPPHGSNMSVWVTSLVNTQEVINLLLEKYKVDSQPSNFALFVIRDNGEQRRLKDDEYPLIVRVMLGPHEDVAKLFLMDKENTEEISNAVAQFLNLSSVECRAILERYQEEEEREVQKVQAKYHELAKRIKQRMSDLKVRL